MKKIVLGYFENKTEKVDILRYLHFKMKGIYFKSTEEGNGIYIFEKQLHSDFKPCYLSDEQKQRLAELFPSFKKYAPPTEEEIEIEKYLNMSEEERYRDYHASCLEVELKEKTPPRKHKILFKKSDGMGFVHFLDIKEDMDPKYYIEVCVNNPHDDMVSGVVLESNYKYE